MKSKNDDELNRIKLRTIALMNQLRISTGALSPYQLSVIIDDRSKNLGWPNMTESNRLYKYFRGDLRKHPTQILNLLSQIFDDVEDTYWKGPGNLWTALWGEVRETSTLIKITSGILEQSTTEEALNKIYMDYIVHGDLPLTSAIATYRYLATTDPYGRFGDGYGFGRAFSMYIQLIKTLKTENIKNYLSKLGVYEGVQEEIASIERERVTNKPHWVSPIECGRFNPV